MPLAKLPSFKGSNRLTVTGLLTGAHSYKPMPSEGIYLLECNDCSVSVDSRAAKVSVDRCNNVKITLLSSPLTSTLEITHSDNVDVYCSEECTVNTVMVDDSDNITIHVTDVHKQLETVWWNKVSKVYVDRGGDLGLFLLDKIEENNKITLYQHVCKLQGDASFTKEPVFRENGYPTTEKEVEHFKGQQRIADEHMFKMMLKSLRMDEREMYAKIGAKLGLSFDLSEEAPSASAD